MEVLKTHWPKIAVGVAALGISFLVFRSSKAHANQVIDIEAEKENVDGTYWPSARRIVNPQSSPAVQKKQFSEWLDEVLDTFIKKHGSFKVNSNNNLSKEDFFEIYDLIETKSRFELEALRSKNELHRKAVFKIAFFDSDIKGAELAAARRGYIQAIGASLGEEIELYKKTQEAMLKTVKVNENIWNSSMDEYLPGGEEYILNSIKYSLSSPFTYHGKLTEDEAFEVYQKSVKFGIQMVTKGAVSEKEEASSNFLSLAVAELGSEDEQDKLLILDYLVTDHAYWTKGMNSTELKSAISAYSLTETVEMGELFQEVANEILKK